MSDGADHPTSDALLATRRMRVPMRDVDTAGIIYFPMPYAWHEGLYTSWLAEIGHPLSRLLEDGLATVTVASQAEYRRPISLDDVIALELRAGSAGRSSFELRTLCLRPETGELCVEVTSTHVWSAIGDGAVMARAARSAPLPTWLRARLDGREISVDLDAALAASPVARV